MRDVVHPRPLDGEIQVAGEHHGGGHRARRAEPLVADQVVTIRTDRKPGEYIPTSITYLHNKARSKFTESIGVLV